MKYCVVFLIFILSSCAGFKEVFVKRSPLEHNKINYGKLTGRDYKEFLANLGTIYRTSEKENIVKLSKRNHQYLTSIYNKIIINNELLLNDEHYRVSDTPQFTVIRNDAPFYFSLPNAQFFFSSGLIFKYLRNEMLLASVLSQEIVRSSRLIYEKRFIPPLGYITTQSLLALTSIDVQMKNEINKWAFLSLKRAGYDGIALLTWIQTQNKNGLDFTFMLRDVRNLSREEYLFKRFIVAHGMNNTTDNLNHEHTSSGEFYRLMRDLQKKIQI